MSRPAGWTRETAIAALRLDVAQRGGIPAAKDWRRAASGRPVSVVCLTLFGSWNAFLAEAGFIPRKSHGQYKPRWTSEAIIKAVRDWTAKHGRPPRATDWYLAQPDHPSAARVRQRFGGSWTRALEAAGLTVNLRRPPAPRPSTYLAPAPWRRTQVAPAPGPPPRSRYYDPNRIGLSTNWLTGVVSEVLSDERALRYPGLPSLMLGLVGLIHLTYIEEQERAAKLEAITALGRWEDEGGNLGERPPRALRRPRTAEAPSSAAFPAQAPPVPVKAATERQTWR